MLYLGYALIKRWCRANFSHPNHSSTPNRNRAYSGCSVRPAGCLTHLPSDRIYSHTAMCLLTVAHSRASAIACSDGRSIEQSRERVCKHPAQAAIRNGSQPHTEGGAPFRIKERSRNSFLCDGLSAKDQAVTTKALSWIPQPSG